MNRLPGALFVVDIRKERLAVKEAKTLGIPVIAIVDTNVDPTLIDFPIPANDDSLKTIALISKEITDSVIMGKEASKAQAADLAAADESQKDLEIEEMDESNIKTKKRTRSRKGASPAENAEETATASDSTSDSTECEGRSCAFEGGDG